MPDSNSLRERVFSVNDSTFDALALEVFEWQFNNNTVYRSFAEGLNRTPNNVSRVNQIPFLPIEFFKTNKVKTGNWEPKTTFTSSGTTGQVSSKHLVNDLAFYHEMALNTFDEMYGPISDYTLLALLPSYLEREGSGLVSMASYFIEKAQPGSGFYLNDHAALNEVLQSLQQKGEKVILLGVTFGLLDFAAEFSFQFPELIVMETGGMKGRREELVRTEVHQILKRAFGVDRIHSEYGMTELFSQAYSQNEGLFQPARTMRVIARDLNDPLSYPVLNRNGGLNIIDLANFDTCSFIETKDLGVVNDNGTFFVNGRIDNSDIRGCNLMIV